FGKLVHISRDNVERRMMPGATGGIADEETFRHVPGMGLEAPFGRHDRQAFAGSGFTGESVPDPRDRNDAGGNLLEKIASGTFERKLLFVSVHCLRSLFLPTFPFQPGTVHSKLHQTKVLHLCHVSRAPVRTTKADVAGTRAEHVDLAQLVTAGRKFHYRPFAVPRNVQISIYITAHPVEAMVLELFQ